MVVLCSTAGFTRLSLDGALRAIRDLGFDRVDLLAIDGWAHVLPSDLVQDYDGTMGPVRRLFKTYGLTPGAVNTAVRPLLHDRSPGACAVREAQTLAIVRMMQDLGVSVATWGPREPDRGMPEAELLAASAASLRDIVALTGPAGITVALECHINSVAERVDAALALLDRVPGLTLAYDPSHLVMQGIDLRETVPLIERAGHIHLRDADLGKMQVPYGQGVIDFDWLLETCKARGYGGGIAIEYLDGGKTDVAADIRALRDKLAEHCMV